ncbi:MAG: 3-hydroxyacyl-CoA dehydrogenase family protein [Thermoplasmata archaeon]
MSAPISSPRPIGTVFVIGSGIMGRGIAAQAALGGHPVWVEDVRVELAEQGAADARRMLDRAAAKSGLSADALRSARDRIRVAADLDRCAEADLVIEAAPEKLELKQELFASVEAQAPAHALLASNTSSLPIGQIGEPLRDPGRLVGLHFFNPVLQMPLVELIASARTRPEATARAEAFARGLGKTVVHSADRPGFVTTRALAALLNEAIGMLEEGVATRDDIDTAYKLGFNHPLGPFELADLVGLDTALSILDILREGFQDPRYEARPMLRRLVAEGKLGRKTGEGFYRYPAAKDRRP